MDERLVVLINDIELLRREKEVLEGILMEIRALCCENIPDEFDTIEDCQEFFDKRLNGEVYALCRKALSK